MQDSAPEPAVKLTREKPPIPQPVPWQAAPKAGHSIHVWGPREGVALCTPPGRCQARLRGWIRVPKPTGTTSTMGWAGFPNRGSWSLEEIAMPCHLLGHRMGQQSLVSSEIAWNKGWKQRN